MNIRTMKPDELDQVFALVERAFVQVFESDHREQLLVRRLVCGKNFNPQLSIVAVDESETIRGYSLSTEINLEPETEDVRILSLAPLAVERAWQHQGIGSLLLKASERKAEELGYGAIAILGFPNYYGKFGYVPASSFDIRFPFDAPSDCCLIKELINGSLNFVSGTLHYPTEFFE